MKKEDIYHVSGIIIALIIFWLGNRNATPKDKEVLGMVFVAVIILYFGINLFSYTKSKLNQIEENQKELKKLKKKFLSEKVLKTFNINLVN